MTSSNAASAPVFVPLKVYAASRTGSLVVPLFGVILISLGAHIDLPMIPVPMSMQTYAVLLIGALAGLRLGALTVVLYIVAAALGAPIFSGGASGVSHLMGPTAGYLLGFVLAAGLTGYLAEKGWSSGRLLHGTLVMLLGHGLILVLGTAWLAGKIGVTQALEGGMYPFILGGIAKSLMVALTILGLKKVWKV